MEKISPTCFILMPFGNWFDQYYSLIYRPAIEAVGLSPVRADEIFATAHITSDIIKALQDSSAVLAELTGRNPNVFYELGLAHAMAKPTVLLSSNMEDVPFDLRHMRVLYYDTQSPLWAEDLKGAITESLTAVLENPESSVLPEFVNVSEEEETLKQGAKEVPIFDVVEKMRKQKQRTRKSNQ